MKRILLNARQSDDSFAVSGLALRIGGDLWWCFRCTAQADLAQQGCYCSSIMLSILALAELPFNQNPNNTLNVKFFKGLHFLVALPYHSSTLHKHAVG